MVSHSLAPPLPLALTAIVRAYSPGGILGAIRSDR